MLKCAQIMYVHTTGEYENDACNKNDVLCCSKIVDAKRLANGATVEMAGETQPGWRVNCLRTTKTKMGRKGRLRQTQ